MSTMTKDPMRTTEKRDDIISSGPKHYARLVTGPTYRYFWLTALGSTGLLSGLVILVAWVLWLKGYQVNRETVAVPITIAILFGVAIAGFLAAREGQRLHDDYMETPDRTTTLVRNEHGILSEGRGVTVNGVRNAIVMHRPDKELEGVIFRGEWLEKMTNVIQDNDLKLTRDKSGISNDHYAECRAALLKAGYITDRSIWTEGGVQWVQTV